MEDDCNMALALNSDYVKAYLRRGVARKHLGKLEEAKQGGTGLLHVNLRLKRKHGNEPEILPFHFLRKKVAQVEFKPTTSCFQDSHSTN